MWQGFAFLATIIWDPNGKNGKCMVAAAALFYKVSLRKWRNIGKKKGIALHFGASTLYANKKKVLRAIFLTQSFVFVLPGR